jgi:threonine dehydratase
MERSDLLRLILTSRVYDVAVETPLEPAPRLSRRLGNEVVLKREDLQRVFSFTAPTTRWRT